MNNDDVMIDAIVILGLLSVSGGVYIVYNIGWSMIVTGVLLIAGALYRAHIFNQEAAADGFADDDA